MILAVKALCADDPSIALLELAYEDHIQEDPVNAYRLVCNFLSVPFEPVGVPHIAINSGSLIDLISNFEAVSDHLSGTRFEWMLEL